MFVIRKLIVLILYVYRYVRDGVLGIGKINGGDNGFIVIDNYIDPDQCQKLKNEIKVLPDALAQVYDNDRRIFGSQHLSKEISKKFAERVILQELGELLVNRKLRYQTTLAGAVSWREGALGSGGSWHVDSHSTQFKAMIYLSDVSEKNGPFEVVPGSHRPKWFLLFLLKNWLRLNSTTRFEDSIIQKYDTVKILGKMGTLVLFNPLLVHRGAPLIEGERFALTNYYVDSRLPNDSTIDLLDKAQKI